MNVYEIEGRTSAAIAIAGKIALWSHGQLAANQKYREDLRQQCEDLIRVLAPIDDPEPE